MASYMGHVMLPIWLKGLAALLGSTLRIKTMVLYIFCVGHSDYLKVGYTGGCPWARVREGLWKVVHPKACCTLLGWDNLELLGLFPGDLADEARLQARVPPECGEFWPQERLEELRRTLTDIAVEKGCTREEAELPLPARPEAPLPGRGEERFECCGGSPLKCFGCGLQFKLWVRLQTHKRESCPASALPKVDCATCGTKVIARHLKRHMQTARCKAARAD